MNISKPSRSLRVLIFTILGATAMQASSSQSDITARLYGGYTLHDTETFTLNGQSGDIDFDSGWMAGGSLGLAMNPNWTVELSWDYSTHEIAEGSISAAPATMTNIEGGDYSSNSFFINGIFIPEALSPKSLRPYVGVGIGLLQEIDVDLVDAGVETSYSTGGEMATQWMVGIRQGIDSQTAVQLELRGVHAKNLTLNEEGGDNQLIDIDYKPLTVNAGIVYHF